MRKNLLKIVLYINYLTICALLLAYLSIFVSPENIGLLAFFGLGYPFIIFANLAFVVFWVIKLKPYFLISLLSILIGWNYLNDFFPLRIKENPIEIKETDFKFMSYNVRLFDLYNWSQNNNTTKNIFDFISYSEPDIMCLQEFYSNEKNAHNTLDTILQFQKAKNSHVAFIQKKNKDYHFGVATFSCFPIVAKGEIQFENSNNICIFSDIEMNDQTIRVYNTHLQSIHFGYDDYQFIDSLQTQKKHWENIWSIMKKLRTAYIKRAKQAQIINNHIANSPYPVIICGDFNDTPTSYVYQQIRQNLKDAFVETGTGIGSTYNGLVPFLRIDYILHNEKLKSYNFERPKIKHSDHYPIICKFQLNKKKMKKKVLIKY